MKKLVAISALIVLVMAVGIWPDCARAESRLANQGLRGLNAQSIDEVLALPEEDIDLAKAVLLLSKEMSADTLKTDVDVAANLRELDGIALELLDKIEQEKDPEARIRLMNKVIFARFEAIGSGDFVASTDDPRNYLLDLALKERRGGCFSLSLLYLALAERLGLPLRGVATNKHFFVRYDGDGVRLNIETTDGGRVVDSDYYRQKLGADFYENPFWMTSLSKKQMLGVYLGYLGHVYYEKNMLDKAGAFLERALSLAPGSSAIHNSMGKVHMKNQKWKEAEREFLKTSELDPDYAGAYSNLGVLYDKMGDTQKAKRAFEKNLEMDPKSSTAHANLGYMYGANGEYQKAVDHYRRAIENTSDFNKLNGYYANSHYLLALLSADKADCPEAKNNYLKAVDLGFKGDDAFKQKIDAACPDNWDAGSIWEN